MTVGKTFSFYLIEQAYHDLLDEALAPHNTALKNRLATFAEKYPAECRLIDDDENGCQTYEVSKGRFGFKLTPPYSKERRQAASDLAKKNIENLRRITK